jgi:hypothetical protein
MLQLFFVFLQQLIGALVFSLYPQKRHLLFSHNLISVLSVSAFVVFKRHNFYPYVRHIFRVRSLDVGS